MGKAEGSVSQRLWHGHVTAVSVAPEYRRLGVAAKLMNYLEEVSERKNCFFVDLFVRVSNTVAVTMYETLGYVVYRRVLGYYSGLKNEDAFGEYSNVYLGYTLKIIVLIRFLRGSEQIVSLWK
jgi:N-terminal acetyltransferase B complex catalytic subunit